MPTMKVGKIKLLYISLELLNSMKVKNYKNTPFIILDNDIVSHFILT